MAERHWDTASPDERKAAANALINYHAPISKQLTSERTSYSSQLIPVTAYICVACVETFYRYPDMMRIIDAAMPAEQIGKAGHAPGSNVNSVYLWSIANFWLTGRNIVRMIDPSLDVPENALVVLDFWERAARSFRHDDGTRQAHDADGVVRPYGDELLAQLLAGVIEVTDEEHRARIKKFNATLVNYLFLLYFDTRVGTGDTGPYPLPDGRVLLVRDFYRMGRSDFWWSDVADEVPFGHLVAAMVLDDVDIRVSDFGSCVTDPEDYLDRLVGFGLFTTDTPDGGLAPVDDAAMDALVATLRSVQSRHYRNIAAMSRDEMIRCGAYVYFTFLRPFAEVAGVVDDLDWEVPKVIPEPLYQMLSMIQGDEVALDPDAPYFPEFE